MNLLDAVEARYKCALPEIPEDGIMRSFPIDQFSLGFVINLPGVCAFGCWSEGDIYYFDGVEWHATYVAPAKPPKQELNRMIIACARGLAGRGEKLDKIDAARLKFAVQQVEASS